MRRIESAQNPRIKELRKRQSSKSFARDFLLIEGRKLLREALASGIDVREVFVTSDAWEQEKRWLGPLENGAVAVTLIGQAALERLSTLETPPGILAIAARPAAPAHAAPRRFGALLFSIRDPGNLGALIRSAEAAGFEFVACSKDTADPMQPKVLRASMGSCFRVPVFRVADTEEYLEGMRKSGVRLYGLQPRDGKILTETEVKAPALVLIGSESHGLPADLPDYHPVSIPMAGKVESLNAAMAATVCFYYFAFFSR